jgi:hypothetical protein
MEPAITIVCVLAVLAIENFLTTHKKAFLRVLANRVGNTTGRLAA